MKNLLNLLAVAVVILWGLFSCMKAEQTPVTENEKGAEVTLEAVLAESQATKTSVNDAGTVYWNPGDSIMVFFGKYAVPFFSFNSTPSAKALFVGTSLTLAGSLENADGELEGYNYWGVYPMRTRKAKYTPSRDNESVFAYVDALQAGKAGTFDNSTLVTVACSTDWKQLSFYNLCGGIRFKLTAENIDIVTFQGNNGEKLAGEVKVKMDAEGHPYPAEVYSIQPELQLRAPAGECFKPGVWYYIVSLPAQLSKGYTMNFVSTAAGKIATKTVSDAKEIKRSVFGEIADADAGLEWVEGFDESMLGDMEDAIEVTKVVYNEEQYRYDLEVVYHNRVIQQLAEKAGIRFILNDIKEFWNQDTHYLFFTTRYEYDGLDREAFSYEEITHLEAVLNRMYNQLYLIKGKDMARRTFDLSTITLSHIYGSCSYVLYTGNYLGSSEDGKEHYFFRGNNDWPPTYGLYTLKEEGEKVYVKQAIDLSQSLAVENLYDYYYKAGTLYLFGADSKGIPVAEAFGLDGSYKMAQLELEAGYQANGYYYDFLNYDPQNTTYYLSNVYKDNWEESCCIFWLEENESEFAIRHFILPGSMNRKERFNGNIVFSTTKGGWCFLTPEKRFSFPNNPLEWSLIENSGKVPVFVADPLEFTVQYYIVNPSAGTVGSKLLALPEYDGEISACFSPGQNECYVFGRAQNHAVLSVTDADTGEVKETSPYTGDFPDLPNDIWWVDGWVFDRPYDAAITIDGDFSDWNDIEAVGAGNHKAFKCTLDDKYIYFFTWIDNQNEYYASLADNPVYLALDTDKQANTGVYLGAKGPYEFVGWFHPFSRDAADVLTVNLKPGVDFGTSCVPYSASLQNIYCKGVVDETGARIEYRIPRADLPDIPETPFVVYSWGGGLSEVEYHVGEAQPEPESDPRFQPNVSISINGDMSDWADVNGVVDESEEAVNLALKVFTDNRYLYLYNKRSTFRSEELWSSGGYIGGYIYYAFDLDDDPTTGEVLNENGPYEMIFYFYPFAADHTIAFTGTWGAAPSGVSLDNLIVDGVVSETSVEVEARIPLADLVTIPKTPIKVYVWSNKGGGTKLELAF